MKLKFYNKLVYRMAHTDTSMNKIILAAQRDLSYLSKAYIYFWAQETKLQRGKRCLPPLMSKG